MIVCLVIIFSTLFIILNLILFYGLITFFAQSNIFKASDIGISIVIACKNESISLPELLRSLDMIEYPADNFEVIFVDDLSDDDSYAIIEKAVKSKVNYKLVRSENKIYPGKKGALTTGIELAKFPFVLITDGDCVVSRNWLKGFAKKFGEGYDFVFGICPIIKEKHFTSLISCFENLRTEMLTFGVANLGLPYSAAARSFGFKKDSFLKLEGYKNTTETLSGDDDLLLREAVKNKFKIGMLNNPGTFVYTKSELKLSDYFRQKKRHTSTSNFYLLRHKIVLGFWHGLNLIALGSIFFIPVSIYFILPFLIKIITDIFLIKIFMERFGVGFSLIELFNLQICYEFFLVIHYLNISFSKNITWKNN